MVVVPFTSPRRNNSTTKDLTQAINFNQCSDEVLSVVFGGPPLEGVPAPFQQVIVALHVGVQIKQTSQQLLQFVRVAPLLRRDGHYVVEFHQLLRTNDVRHFRQVLCNTAHHGATSQFNQSINQSVSQSVSQSINQ